MAELGVHYQLYLAISCATTLQRLSLVSQLFILIPSTYCLTFDVPYQKCISHIFCVAQISNCCKAKCLPFVLNLVQSVTVKNSSRNTSSNSPVATKNTDVVFYKCVTSAETEILYTHELSQIDTQQSVKSDQTQR